MFQHHQLRGTHACAPPLVRQHCRLLSTAAKRSSEMQKTPVVLPGEFACWRSWCCMSGDGACCLRRLCTVMAVLQHAEFGGCITGEAQDPLEWVRNARDRASEAVVAPLPQRRRPQSDTPAESAAQPSGSSAEVSLSLEDAESVARDGAQQSSAVQSELGGGAFQCEQCLARTPAGCWAQNLRHEPMRRPACANLRDSVLEWTTGRTPARKRFKTLKELKTLLKPRQGFEGVLDACEEIWPAWAANGCRKLDLRVRAGSVHTDR